MNEFSSSFWDYYISIVTIVSILACGALLVGQSRRKVAGGTRDAFAEQQVNIGDLPNVRVDTTPM